MQRSSGPVYCYASRCVQSFGPHHRRSEAGWSSRVKLELPVPLNLKRLRVKQKMLQKNPYGLRNLEHETNAMAQRHK